MYWLVKNNNITIYLKQIRDNFKRGYVDLSYFKFDINQPMPIGSDIKLIDIVRTLNKLEINYFVADGTLLGIIRENKLIEHDTDIDFYVIDCKKNILKIIIEMFKKKYKIGRIVFYRGKLQQIIFYDKTKLIVDFCIWRQKGDKVELFVPEINKKRTQNIDYFIKPHHILFKETNLRTFNNPIKWLGLIYGNEWNIPQKSKTPWYYNVRDVER